ncbi:MAG: hypothetical protein ACLFWF_04455 [Alphaproteobacteria bacterium]
MSNSAALRASGVFRTAAGHMPLYGGVFLLCFALLSFEITTVRTMNFILGPG